MTYYAMLGKMAKAKESEAAMKRPIYQYRVEVYKRKDGKWESRILRARGEKNVIYTSAGQGYNTWQAALKIAKNIFGTGYGILFVVRHADGTIAEQVPW